MFEIISVLLLSLKSINFLDFEMDVILQNGQFYEAKLPLSHCPATSGCRALVKQNDGNTIFQLTENFVLTLKVVISQKKLIWKLNTLI